jgi:hypothetical protein
MMTTLNQSFVTSQSIISKHQGASNEFRQARLRGLICKTWAILAGKNSNLLDVNTITQGKSIRNCRYIGACTIPLQKIKGSEGRCQDFDENFNPLKLHNRQRWASIAQAWEQGIYLPAVDLIKVGDQYIVRDGHHRISVAMFKGADYIDAHVTEWTLDT